MTTTCEAVQDRLPELAAGRLAPGTAGELRTHLAGCDACAGELVVLEALAASPVAVPAGLEARIQAAVAARGSAEAGVRDIGSAPSRRSAGAPGGFRIPAWGWAVAAGLALFLGRGVWTGPDAGGAERDLGLMAQASGEYSALPADDGVVAGAPLLDGLTEDDLNALLEEWDG